VKEYPPIVLEHLNTLTDRTGVIQHAIFSIPNRHTGYCTDDNARALIVAVKEYERTRRRSLLALVSAYLSFLHYAQTPSKRFHNFMSFDQIFLDDVGSEDSFGRTLWACGCALEANIHENVKKVARQLVDEALRWVPMLYSPRGRAFSILGLRSYARAYPEAEDVSGHADRLADSLVKQFNDLDGWRWFEPCLTYENGIMPMALLSAYDLTRKQQYVDTAIEALQFLKTTTVVDGVLQPVGCNGWYIKGGERAWFDQQPVDATSMTLACLSAYEATHDEDWLNTARLAFDWFFGANVFNEPMYDPVTGGCYDGLTSSGPNLNQGAESTVSCLMAQLWMYPYVETAEPD